MRREPLAGALLVLLAGCAGGTHDDGGGHPDAPSPTRQSDAGPSGPGLNRDGDRTPDAATSQAPVAEELAGAQDWATSGSSGGLELSPTDLQRGVRATSGNSYDVLSVEECGSGGVRHDRWRLVDASGQAVAHRIGRMHGRTVGEDTPMTLTGGCTTTRLAFPADDAADAAGVEYRDLLWRLPQQ